MLDLLIRGGLVVTPEDVGERDVGVEGGRIAAVAWPGTLPAEAGRVIDARGKIVLPGGIEPHAHIAIPVPERWAGRPEVMTQPPEAVSRAAAFGGVTTVIDFAGDLNPSPGANSPPESIMRVVEERRKVFHGHAYTDFAFHYILAGQVAPEVIGQIGEAVQEGIASFKIFTTFPGLRVPYGHLWAVFAEVAKHGGVMAVHAEDDDIVTYMEEKLTREGRDQGYHLHLVHNNLSEDLAFRKIIRLARHTEAGIYFVHTTAKEGVRAIAEARDQRLPVYGEALHNYLQFTCEDYKKPDGTAIHTYPAIKFADDRDALQAGLINGDLCTTATDEYTTYKDVKLSGDTIHTVCGGHNGIETRLPVAFTKFVSQRGMSLQRFAAITSTNAAKILGLYPQKGAIAPGSDADLVLIDPNLRKTLTLDDLHADSDYSIWEGFACQGYPVMTILRGKVIVEDGRLLGSSADGRWLRRNVSADVRARPVV
ncbi:MAG TPA: amidohydrolase family protein [Candidatus Tectomicrobia bacterium]|nr:amidohydrolase family protein [Candidatus Tectomicrobia bacterium]